MNSINGIAAITARLVSTELSLQLRSPIVDDITVVDGDTVLFTNTTNKTQRGLYTARVVSGFISYTRTFGFDTNDAYRSGLYITITAGTVYTNTLWKILPDRTLVTGASDLIFTQTTIGAEPPVITGGSVLSVEGRGGDVDVLKADVGLSNVDNTSDTNKPVGSAQQTALNLKGDKALPEYTWVTKPSAAAFGKGYAFLTDLNAVGYSNGVAWRLSAGNIRKPISNIGTRILDARMGAFDNTTVKTFRAIIEVAAAGFDQVRPIFGNGSTSVTYTVSACNVRALANLTDALPSPTAATLPSSGIVPVSATALRRNYLVGNWIDLQSVPRTDGGTGALVCIDAYVSTASSITILGNGSNDVFTGWATRANRKWIMRHNDGDCVTTPANFVSVTNRIQSPIVGLQYAARGQVITVMGIGDSITSGRGTIIGEGFGVPACEQAQATTSIPFEWMGCGWAGNASTSYKQYIVDAVTAGIIPHAIVCPHASPNDYFVPITPDRIALSQAAFAEINRVAGANNLPIISWTVMPTNPSVKDYNSSDSLRVALNNSVLAYPGINIADFSATLSGVTDGDGQVNLLVGSTTDGIHPNDAGNALLAPVLANYLIRLAV